MLMSPNNGEEQLMAATARVIWLCACVKYWPYRGVGTYASVLMIGIFRFLGLIKFKYSETSINAFGALLSVRLIDLIEGVRLIEVGKNCAMLVND